MPITKPVGDDADNEKGDAFFIQFLLADWQTRKGIAPITVDGLVGTKTIAAIKAFQTAETGIVDGVIDPDGPALKRLEALHIQGMSQNEITTFPPFQPLIGAPAITLPAGTNADLHFQRYLQLFRDGLE